MRLAVFYPASLWSAWACSYGLVDALNRMGHEVLAIGIDPKTLLGTLPPDIAEVDGYVISGPEHIGKSPAIVNLPKKPSVAWMHETIEREDYGRLDVEALKRSADVVFCPGIQDEAFGFRYLPFGVDTEIFKPDPNAFKNVDAGFIGLMYPKRQEFIAKLKPQLNGTKLRIGNVQVLEVDGINPRKTALLYAENIRRMKLFVNLPTLSQLAVTKIYEVLACGTPILTQEVTDMRNLEGLPIATYKTADECAAKIKQAVTIDAAAIQSAHRLEMRCEKLVAALKEIA